MLSENEGDGELGGRVMELIKLGPLSILRHVELGEHKLMTTMKNRKKCVEFLDSEQVK